MSHKYGLRWSSTLASRTRQAYRPLQRDEIRVLELQPGRGDEPVECSLQHVSLRENPHYQTLSYCWGGSQADTVIRCQQQRFAITHNLSSALRSLRYETRVRRLWVDALCIDQKNLQERASQVQIMGDIFRQSEQTAIWLGEGSETSGVAIEKLREYANASSGSELEFSVWKRMGAATGIKSSLLPAVYTLLERPWFTRTWVIQELAVAKSPELICGPARLSWDELTRAITHLLETCTYFAYPCHPIFQIVMLSRMRRDFQAGIFPPLLNNLQRSRTFQASDPRDKVFALLGLSDPRDLEKLDICPDYQISAPELYRQVAERMLTSNPKLDLFSASGAPSAKGLPSWVPEWSTPSVTISLSARSVAGLDHLKGMESFPSFHAAGDSVCSPQVTDAGSQLKLCGMEIDRVAAVGCSLEYSGEEGVHDFAKFFAPDTGIVTPLGEWETLTAAHSDNRYVTGEDRRDVFWTTLCAGHWPPDAPRVGFWVKMVKRHRVISWLAFKIIRAISREDLLGKVAVRGLEMIHMISSRLTAHTRNVGLPAPTLLSNQRRMMRTAKGYIGLAPLNTNVDDLVVLMEGGRVPYVLKPGEKDHVLAGECYLHGVMNGELWDASKCKTLYIR